VTGRAGRARVAARLALLLLAGTGAAACAVRPEAGTPVTAGAIAAGTATEVDLIVTGDHVVTMEGDRPDFSDGAVAIDDGRIVAVGPRAEIVGRYRAAETLDGRNRVVLPGLINGHAHSAMTLMRGIADDRELMDWLRNFIFPTEVRFVNAEFVRIGTELACWEMIRGGTTTLVDMYYFPDAVAEAIESCGLRALVAPTVIDQKSPDAADAADSLRVAAQFAQRWKGRNKRIIPVIGPHSVYTVKPEQLQAVRAKARELGVPVSIHLAESRFEIDYSKQHYSTTPVDMLEKLGFFDGPTIGAHVIYPTEAEIPVLARHKVGAIHCPTSNMKISSGVAPIAKMLAAGVPVGLGTDGAATNNDLDLWEEMRLAAFLQKVSTMDPTVVPARTALTMATSGGAAAIGLADQIGSLTAGKRADLIQVSLDDLHFTPLYDLISHLVYVADEQDVVSVVVDGEVLMRDHKVLTVDVERVRSEAAALAAKIRASLVESGRATPQR
jgi:5-methylthioadenosine/S-adenosylhomocysteine deaminase